MNNFECVDQYISTFQDILGGEVFTSREVVGTTSTALYTMVGLCPPCATAAESMVVCTVNELNGAGGQSCDIDCSASNGVDRGGRSEGSNNTKKRYNIGPDFIHEHIK